MNSRPTFARELLKRLQDEQTRRFSRTVERAGLPEYNVEDASDINLLFSRSTPISFCLGTGADIYDNVLIPSILSAKFEVILVTCFWARSKTQSALSDALSELSRRRRTAIEHQLSNGGPLIPVLRIRICLSSLSILQKLFHTSSRDGYVYPPSSWPSALGLPDESLLATARIDLQVKSLFFLPFSVMHPKFLIVDQTRAFVPSCNVSWESWLEGCVGISGDAVAGLHSFYSRTWEGPSFRTRFTASESVGARVSGLDESPGHAVPATGLDVPSKPIETIILPSSHHRNPRFHPFPWQAAPTAPRTALNLAMLQLVADAQNKIYIQTPNFTSQPVLSALLAALERGVDVVIVTSRNMMLLEQLVTAGTTTSWCLRSLIQKFCRMASSNRRPRASGGYDTLDQLEAQLPATGHLRISYYRPPPGGRKSHLPPAGAPFSEDPLQSHLKLTIVDGGFTLLGSGNMDRASWFTSQELGVLFCDQRFAATVQDHVSTALNNRLELIFDSRTDERCRSL